MSQHFLAAQNTSSITTWLSTLDGLASLTPAMVVPSHGSIGSATLIARDRAFLQTVQEHIGELKRAGKSNDEAVAAVVTDIAPKYPELGNPSGAAAAARAAYAEARSTAHLGTPTTPGSRCTLALLRNIDTIVYCPTGKMASLN